MKKTTLLLLLAGIALQLSAREGYRIHLKMPDVKDTTVLLAHYYGVAGSKVFISDTAKMKNGNAVFENSKQDFVGGIYIILVGKANFEILLNKGDDFTVTAYLNKLPDGITFKNAPENERFMNYKAFTEQYGNEQKQLEDDLKSATSAADTTAIRNKAIASAQKRIDYMRNYCGKYPGSLLAAIFNAMHVPEVPAGPHLLDDGITKDSTFSYRYYKEHYWDGFDFKDDRLIYTPIYDARIDEYMNKLVLPWPDSVEKESDMLLGKARGTKDVFHYTLYWLTCNAENSKVMGMDEVFVYLVENYYMKGDAFWLTADELQKYINRGQAIAPNVIGNVAPDIKLPDLLTGQTVQLSAISAPYTLVVFYSPNCGHCQHELPLLDSVYEATLKDKGVKVLTIATEGDDKQITDFLKKLKVDKKWINTSDARHTTDCRNKYDVYSTPTIYLLDNKKIIRGKRLSYNNIASVIDMLEHKKISKR